MPLPDRRRGQRVLAILVLLHIMVIAASNYFVQIPFTLFGFHTTWGAYTYPCIFLVTDLTVRILGARAARRVIFRVMFPALFVSYVVSVLFVDGHFAGWPALLAFDPFVGRIVLASFSAYLVGQLMDILVFRRLMRLRFWWVAPSASAVFGTLLDTLVFFSVAFAGSSNAFMANHWMELAATDYSFKLSISLVLFVPVYGVVLTWLKTRLFHLVDGWGDDDGSRGVETPVVDRV